MKAIQLYFNFIFTKIFVKEIKIKLKFLNLINKLDLNLKFKET